MNAGENYLRVFLSLLAVAIVVLALWSFSQW